MKQRFTEGGSARTGKWAPFMAAEIQRKRKRCPNFPFKVRTPSDLTSKDPTTSQQYHKLD